MLKPQCETSKSLEAYGSLVVAVIVQLVVIVTGCLMVMVIGVGWVMGSSQRSSSQVNHGPTNLQL